MIDEPMTTLLRISYLQDSTPSNETGCPLRSELTAARLSALAVLSKAHESFRIGRIAQSFL